MNLPCTAIRHTILEPAWRSAASRRHDAEEDPLWDGDLYGSLEVTVAGTPILLDPSASVASTAVRLAAARRAGFPSVACPECAVDDNEGGWSLHMSYDEASDLVEVVETHRAARASASSTDVSRAIDEFITAFHDEGLAYVPDFDSWVDLAEISGPP